MTSNKKICVLLITMALAGCSTTVPVVRQFPSAPQILSEPCPDLNLMSEGTTQLSEMLLVVNRNYAQYHGCQAKVDAWIDWYNTQKEIFNNVK